MRTVRCADALLLANDPFFQPHYAKSTHSLLMTSSASRSQALNVDDVLAKVGFGLGSQLVH